jgi:hypothetical protein
MESLLFAGIAIVILLPLLYFLPLGFTVKGKLFIAAASTLIGLFGLVAVKLFPLWQTALILALFVSSLAYLLQKRGLDWLYLQEEEVDPFAVEQEPAAAPLKELKESYMYIASSDKTPKTLDETGNGDAAKKPITNIFLQQSPLIRQSHEALTKKKEEQNFNDEAAFAGGEPADVSVTEYAPSPSGEELIEELEMAQSGEVHDLDPDIEAVIHNKEIAEQKQKDAALANHSYLAEVEKMLESGGLGANPETTEELIPSLDEVPVPPNPASLEEIPAGDGKDSLESALPEIPEDTAGAWLDEISLSERLESDKTDATEDESAQEAGCSLEEIVPADQGHSENINEQEKQGQARDD